MTTLDLVCDVAPGWEPEAGADALLLAFTRAALFAMRDRGIPCDTPSSHIPAGSVHALGERAVEALETALSIGETDRDGLAFNPVRPFAYRLLHHFSYGGFVIELLESVIARTPFGAVRVTGANTVVDTVFCEPGLLDPILSAWSTARKIPVARVDSGPACRLVAPAGSGRRGAPATPFVGSTRRRVGDLAAVLAVVAWRLLDRRQGLFVEGRHYDLEVLLNGSFRPVGFRPIDLGRVVEALNRVAPATRVARRHQGELRRWWSEQTRTGRLAGLFAHRGVDLTPLIEQCCRTLIDDDLERGIESFVQARRILSSGRRPIGLVSLGRASDVPGAWIAEAATSAGVPCIGMVHGGTVGLVDSPRHRVHYRDLSMMIHYGPAGALSAACAPRNVGLGSPRLGPLTRIGGTGTGELTTVLWCWCGTRETTVDPWIASWDRLVGPRLEILGSLHDSDLRVVVRPHPGVDDPTLDYARRTYPRLRFEARRRFVDLVPDADVVILEFPGTPLIEALCTAKPILFFAASDVFRYRPGALTLLRRRCVVFDTAEEYVEGVRRFLEDPKPVLEMADVGDTAFQQAYARPVSAAEFREGLLRAVGEQTR